MMTENCQKNFTKKITIFSWNVAGERHKKKNKYYDEDNKSFEERMKNVTEFILRMLMSYDILLLQEVHEKIIDKLHLTNHDLFTSLPTNVVDLETSEKYKKYMVTIIDKKFFPLFIVDEKTKFDTKRILPTEIKMNESESIILLNIHIAIAYDAQMKQLNQLKNIIYDNTTVIVGGDFNVNSRDFFQSINRRNKNILYLKGNTLTSFRFLSEKIQQGLRNETIYGPCDNIMIFSNIKTYIEPIEITNDQYLYNRGIYSDHLCLSCNISFDFLDHKNINDTFHKKRGRLQNNYIIITK